MKFWTILLDRPCSWPCTSTLRISALTFPLTAMSGATSQQLLKAICSEKIKVLDHPIFELQKDGSYINDLNARIVQNAEDQAWFITGLENKGTDQQRIIIYKNRRWSTVYLTEKASLFRLMDSSAQIWIQNGINSTQMPWTIQNTTWPWMPLTIKKYQQ